MSKSVQDLIDDYSSKYGDIPSDESDRLMFIRKHYKIDDVKLKKAINEIDQLKTNLLSFTIPLVPTPSPRPRYSFKTKHFYVSGAGELHKYMDDFLKKEEIFVEYDIPDPDDFGEFVKGISSQIGIICTQTKLSLRTYQPVPTSIMTNIEIYLAELGKIRPISNPDWDNLGKTYCDMIQGRLLLNDNIVSTGLVEKYWSIKPRIDISLEYQVGFDCKFNFNKIVKSTSYKKYVTEFGIQVN